VPDLDTETTINQLLSRNDLSSKLFQSGNTKEENMADFTREEVLEKIKNKESMAEANLEKIDLSACDLSGADFSKTNLEDADFSGSNLRGTNFSEANLQGANLRGASLERANFSKADLRWSDTKGASFRKANLKGAKRDKPGGYRPQERWVK